MSYFPVGRDLTASSDISLVVEEERLPVHSQVILVHSKVLGNMITDLVPKGESHMLVPLSDKKAEVELMLKFFYHTAQRVTEVREMMNNILEFYCLKFSTLSSFGCVLEWFVILIHGRISPPLLC